ncbi:hypothetical protein L3X38_018665 [Prunus dulcis]|uniref:Transcription factor CBF/NF-Y/archaeal histone domain-containing protein n=1 Tax=Prunus dulcis TaxID=3755 RepID=A0AAD4W9M0_PRUDU|nr:hypothetical protein L3X38_018665 [Prunus dulcis]
MDVNRSINITPSSNTSPEMHGFMSTGSFELPNYYSHPSSREEADQEAKQSSFMELQKDEIEIFWNQQLFEIQNTTVAKAHHELPLARVKRVMKSDGQVKKVSSETPVLFSKACELFIMELTLRSWLHTERSKRRTLQHCDTARAIMQDELLHFLVHAVPPLNSVQSDEVKVSKNSIKHGGWGPFQATGYSMNIPSASQFPFHFFQEKKLGFREEEEEEDLKSRIEA